MQALVRAQAQALRRLLLPALQYPSTCILLFGTTTSPAWRVCWLRAATVRAILYGWFAVSDTAPLTHHHVVLTDIEARDAQQNTPLLLSYFLNRTEAAKVLLAAGAAAKARAKGGWEAVEVRYIGTAAAAGALCVATSRAVAPSNGLDEGTDTAALIVCWL